MNRSTIQETFPGGPAPDYESTETQHKATSAAIESNSQTLSGAPGMTEKPSQQGVDVVPAHSVVSRQPDFAIAQSTGNTSSDPAPQPALYSDIEPIPSSRLEPSSSATAAADPKPSAGEDSGNFPRGPSDAAQLPPENPSFSPEAPAGGDAQRSASLASHRTNRSLPTNGNAFADGAATTTNDPPDVDPGLQARAASAEGELRPRDKAVIRKEESTSLYRTSKVYN